MFSILITTIVFIVICYYSRSIVFVFPFFIYFIGFFIYKLNEGKQSFWLNGFILVFSTVFISVAIYVSMIFVVYNNNLLKLSFSKFLEYFPNTSVFADVFIFDYIKNFGLVALFSLFFYIIYKVIIAKIIEAKC